MSEAHGGTAAAADLARRVRAEVEKVLLGQAEALSQLLVALLAGGHVLLEGPPGVAKTLVARGLARALRCSFRRVQFTPDLMPSDLVGTHVYRADRGRFELRRGPVFTNLLLADEINRTPPKTQSALLEAMEEGQVSLDGEAHPLPQPFMVLATQNPIEYEGTYPLPEAQQDRFTLKVLMGYPAAAEERGLLARYERGVDPGDLERSGVAPVAPPEDLQAARAAVRDVTTEEQVRAYIAEAVRATRDLPDLTLGAGPRAGIALLLAGKARALLDGRAYVLPDDVKALAPAVLRHRVILTPDAELEGVRSEELIAQVFEEVTVPR